MDRMSALDAGFFFAESENTPMHVGSVAVFEGPAPSYGDVVRLLLSKLPLVPRYRQRVRPVPMQLGRPLWADDPHFQILYHVRHTAVPSPGSDEQLRNLAGRVLGQRLDMAKPLWELWLVEGLADNRWAIISKVHHCMVDGVAGSELMQLMFDLTPDAEHEAPQDWTPQPNPSSMDLLKDTLAETLTHPLQQLTSMPTLSHAVQAVKEVAESGRTLASTVPSLAKQAITPTARSLNGPIGPHRRWAWTDGKVEEFKAVRAAFGGTVNDVVLTAITRGFHDLLKNRGELSSEKLVVRSMVPVSVRRADQKGAMNNQVTAVFVDLPVGEPDPVKRLASIRGQMDEYKKTMQAVDAPAIIALGNFVAPSLLSLGVRAALQAGQMWCQAVTTNVPGPRFPLYVLGKPMISANAYVPIAGGTRCSIGIFSYLNTMTFGINADFDAFPDVEVLSGGIRAGIEELLDLAATKKGTTPTAPGGEEPAKSAPEAGAPPVEQPAKNTARETAAKATAAKAAAPAEGSVVKDQVAETPTDTARETAAKATAAKGAAPAEAPPVKKPAAETPTDTAKETAAKATATKAAPSKATPSKATPSKVAPSKDVPARSAPEKSSPEKAEPAASTSAKRTAAKRTADKSTAARSTAAKSRATKSTAVKTSPAKATPAKATPAKATASAGR
ncbi:MAG: putative Acyltransferase [Blastococcus sp.]|nr:putative Acyltransferase [Blastococcus sp.]